MFVPVATRFLLLFAPPSLLMRRHLDSQISRILGGGSRDRT